MNSDDNLDNNRDKNRDKDRDKDGDKDVIRRSKKKLTPGREKEQGVRDNTVTGIGAEDQKNVDKLKKRRLKEARERREADSNSYSFFNAEVSEFR